MEQPDNASEGADRRFSDGVMNIFEALPADLRPLYAYVHCNAVAVMKALDALDAKNPLLAAADAAVESLSADAAKFAAVPGSSAYEAFADYAVENDSPVILILDMIWHAIMTSKTAQSRANAEHLAVLDALNADPALEPLAHPFVDLGLLLELIDERIMTLHADFGGSFLTLSFEAVPTAELTKSLRKLSSLSRACYAWGHNHLQTLIHALAANEGELAEALENAAIRPQFKSVIIEQFRTGDTSTQVLKADAKRYNPFDYEFRKVQEQFGNLVRLVEENPDHPMKRIASMQLAALAALCKCRPEDLAATLDNRLNDGEQLVGSHRGLALDLATQLAGIELVDAVEDATDADEEAKVRAIASDFSRAAESTLACQRLCIPLSYATGLVLNTVTDKAVRQRSAELFGIGEEDADALAGSVRELSRFLALQADAEGATEAADQAIAELLAEDHDPAKASEDFQALLGATLAAMTPEHAAAFSMWLISLGPWLTIILQKDPADAAKLFQRAFPNLPEYDIVAESLRTVMQASQQASIALMNEQAA